MCSTKKKLCSVKKNGKYDPLATKAFRKSGCDETFVLLLQAENGSWDGETVHDKAYYLCWSQKSLEAKIAPNQQYNAWKCNSEKGWYWKKHFDRGFCGISDGYYKHIVEDERFLDIDWQMEQCYNLYSNGVTFYGLNATNNYRHMFEFIY